MFLFNRADNPKRNYLLSPFGYLRTVKWLIFDIYHVPKDSRFLVAVSCLTYCLYSLVNFSISVTVSQMKYKWQDFNHYVIKASDLWK